jgi:hypothetical protein
MAVDKKLLQAACDWISENWSVLHGTKEYNIKVDPDMVVGSSLSDVDDVLIVIVDRGILGSPKYYVPLAELEKARVAPKAVAKKEAK